MSEQKPTAEAVRMAKEIFDQHCALESGEFYLRSTSVSMKQAIAEALAAKDEERRALLNQIYKWHDDYKKQRALLVESCLLLKGNQEYLDSDKVNEFLSRPDVMELLKGSKEGERV